MTRARAVPGRHPACLWPAARLPRLGRGTSNPRERHLPHQRTKSGLAVAVACFALAACAFPEGPAWPPLSEQEALRPKPGEWSGPPADPKSGRPNLAPLISGTAADPAERDPATLVGLVRPLMVIRFAEEAPAF